jgi:hypothetical protein
MDDTSPLQQVKERAKESHNNDRYAAVVELLRHYLPNHPEDGYAWFIYGDSLRLPATSLR